MKCPHCSKEITPAQLAAGLGAISSKRKAQAARENGALGGRPAYEHDEDCPCNNCCVDRAARRNP